MSIGQAPIWHPRKNTASPSWQKSPLRKRKGTENKLKARQTNQKADFPFSTFLEEEGREVPYGQKPTLPLDFQLKSQAQGKDNSSPPVRRDCKHNKVSCRKTVQDSHLRLPHWSYSICTCWWLKAKYVLKLHYHTKHNVFLCKGRTRESKCTAWDVKDGALMATRCYSSHKGGCPWLSSLLGW